MLAGRAGAYPNRDLLPIERRPYFCVLCRHRRRDPSDRQEEGEEEEEVPVSVGVVCDVRTHKGEAQNEKTGDRGVG